MVTTTEDFLEHHGVKGMKWGVRKDRAGVVERLRGSRQKTFKNVKAKKAMSRRSKIAATGLTVGAAILLRKKGHLHTVGSVLVGASAVAVATAVRSEKTAAGRREADRLLSASGSMPVKKIGTR